MKPTSSGHDLGCAHRADWPKPLPESARHVVTVVHLWLAACAVCGVLALLGARWGRQDAARLAGETDVVEAEATAIEAETLAERRRVAEAVELRAWLGAAPDLQRVLISLGAPGLGGGYARRIVFEPDAEGGPLRVRVDVSRAGAEGRRLVVRLGEALGGDADGPAVAESAEFGDDGGRVVFRCGLPAWREDRP